MPLFIPPVIGWALGALGAAVAVKFLVNEWQRVNAHLHPGASMNEAMTEMPARERVPTLRRDPRSGVYRPE